jgi:hypothetical protein
MVLVAAYVTRHNLVCFDLLYMSGPENTKNSHSAGCRYAGSVVLQGLYGHYAYADVLRLQVHSSRLLLFGLLAGIDSITEGIY